MLARYRHNHKYNLIGGAPIEIDPIVQPKSLNDSLDNAIDDASDIFKKLIENIESEIQDKEIRNETIELLKNFSKGLRESVELTHDKLNNEIIEKNTFKEEE